MTNNLQSNRLAQIKSRLAAATPGPWRAVRNNAMGETWFNIGADGDENILSMVDDLNDECLTQKISDAELIANCPADLAWLIERCEKLQAVALSLSELLEVHEGECRLDHNNNCQEHMCFGGDGSCFVADAREHLAALESDREV